MKDLHETLARTEHTPPPPPDPNDLEGIAERYGLLPMQSPDVWTESQFTRWVNTGFTVLEKKPRREMTADFIRQNVLRESALHTFDGLLTTLVVEHVEPHGEFLGNPVWRKDWLIEIFLAALAFFELQNQPEPSRASKIELIRKLGERVRAGKGLSSEPSSVPQSKPDGSFSMVSDITSL